MKLRMRLKGYRDFIKEQIFTKNTLSLLIGNMKAVFMNKVIKEWNFFRKVEYVQRLVNKAYPNISIGKLRIVISHISHKQCGYKALL